MHEVSSSLHSRTRPWITQSPSDAVVEVEVEVAIELEVGVGTAGAAKTAEAAKRLARIAWVECIMLVCSIKKRDGNRVVEL